MNVNITELRQNLPAYLRPVRQRERIQVTSRGQVVAELAPHWTVYLLDAAGLQSYLRQFYARFGERFDRTAAAVKFIQDPLQPDAYYNVFLGDLHVFLAPFNLEPRNARRHRQQQGVAILESILGNTGLLLQDSRSLPKARPNSTARCYD
jgi:antitoxin (DNA-binding transcriptional repressor) of toxin-antitoxin stability system